MVVLSTAAVVIATSLNAIKDGTPGGTVSQVDRKKPDTNELNPNPESQRLNYTPNAAEGLIDGEKLLVLAKTDLNSAFSQLDSTFDVKKALRVKIDVLSQICIDKLEPLTEGLALLPAQARISAASSTLNTWAKKDPLRLAAYAKLSLKDELQNIALSKSINKLVQYGKLDDAIRINGEMAKSQGRLDSFKSIAGEMLGRGQSDALTWLGTLPDTDLRSIAEQTFAARVVQTGSVDDAITLANQLTNSAAQNIIIQGVSKMLVRNGDEGIDTWINQLPETLKYTARQSFISEVSKNDIPKATSLAIGITDKQQRERAFDIIQPNIMASGLESTAKWIATIPADNRPRAAYLLAVKWAAIDRSRAKNWIDSLPSGDIRERAQAGIKEHVR